jgi:hypothetical protein
MTWVAVVDDLPIARLWFPAVGFLEHRRERCLDTEDLDCLSSQSDHHSLVEAVPQHLFRWKPLGKYDFYFMYAREHMLLSDCPERHSPEFHFMASEWLDPQEDYYPVVVFEKYAHL